MNILIYVLVLKSILYSYCVDEVHHPFYGRIDYDITEFRGNDFASRRHISNSLEMKDNSYFKFYITPERCKYDIRMFSGVIDIVLQREVVGEEHIDLLMNVFDGKIWISTSRMEVEEQCKHRILPSEVTITYDTTNTKTILGQQCDFFKITINKDHDLRSVEGYLTHDLYSPVSPLYELQAIELNGVPLEFKEVHRGIMLAYVASDISPTLEKGDLEMDVEDYSKMSLSSYISRFGACPRMLN